MKDVLAVIALSLCLAGATTHAVADCPPSLVSSSVLVGDGSTPTYNLYYTYPHMSSSDGSHADLDWGTFPDTGFFFTIPSRTFVSAPHIIIFHLHGVQGACRAQPWPTGAMSVTGVGAPRSTPVWVASKGRSRSFRNVHLPGSPPSS